MTKKKISVVWSDEAKADLKYIHDRILRKTKSVTNAGNVKRDIIKASKAIDYVRQFQEDEFLGNPYRRIIVRHFRMVYLPDSESSILVLEVFDSYTEPGKLRK